MVTDLTTLLMVALGQRVSTLNTVKERERERERQRETERKKKDRKEKGECGECETEVYIEREKKDRRVTENGRY